MESSLKNMTVTLLAIALASSLAVGLVYRVTEQPIAEAKSQKIGAAIAQVLPPFDNDPAADTTVVPYRDGEKIKEIVVYTARQGENTVGYAIKTFSKNGFGGEIWLMAGFLPDGTICKVETLTHNETPGLGNKIERGKSDFAIQFEGKNPETFRLSVKKDGGDVDAITASTISSRAFTDALTRAYEVFESIQKPE